MLNTFTMRTDDMPEDMRVLLQTYPRDGWGAHPGFKEKTRNWLSAHQMFRRLAKRARTVSEDYLDRDIDSEAFAGQMSFYGDALVRNLHGHHGWEDHSYFPELSAADPRFDAGLDLLEKDHADLDVVLDQFVTTANRAIKLMHLDEAQGRDEVGALHGTAEVIEAFLQRHLGDEEDLAVPIILHHRLRG